MQAIRVAPTDPVLPQLGTALDVRAMGAVIEAQLLRANGKAFQLVHCEIERVKYRPGRNCMVGYRLRLRGGSQGIEQEARLCADFYSPVEARERFERASDIARVEGLHFAPVTLVSALGMVMWAFPNDRKLHALPLLADPAIMRNQLLLPMVREHWGEDVEIADLAHRVVCYFPEHTCTVGADLTLRQPTGARLPWQVLGKVRYDDEGARTFRLMQALHPKQIDGVVSYARPVGYDAAHRLLWQERVPGVTLGALLSARRGEASVLARVGRALGALHTTSLASERSSSIADICARLSVAGSLVSNARPALAGTVMTLVERLIAASANLDSHHSATVHGDFHSNNVLISEQSVSLVDMDRVSCGPPLAELGSLLAELIHRACGQGEPAAANTVLGQAAISAYAAAVPWPISANDIAWHTAAALVNERIGRSITSLKPARPDLLERLLAAAQTLSNGGPLS